MPGPGIPVEASRGASGREPDGRGPPGFTAFDFPQGRRTNLYRVARHCGVAPGPDLDALWEGVATHAFLVRCTPVGATGAGVFSVFVGGTGGVSREAWLVGGRVAVGASSSSRGPVDLFEAVQGGTEALRGPYASAPDGHARVHPDGRVLMTGSRQVGIWSVDGAAEWRFPGHVRHASFLPDGRAVAIWGDGSELTVLDPDRVDTYNVEPWQAEGDPNGSTRFRCPRSRPDTVPQGSARLVVEADEQSITVRRETPDGAVAERSFALASCGWQSPDNRYLAIPGTRGGLAVHDLSLISDDPSAPPLVEIPVTDRFRVDFIGEGPDFFLITGNQVARVRARPDPDVEPLFTADLPLRHVALSPDGDRLLVTENEGQSWLVGELWSLEADLRWRTLGRDYKHYEAWFADDHTVVYIAGGPPRQLTLHRLPEAVRHARSALDEHCRDFAGDDPTSSSCWPRRL